MALHAGIDTGGTFTDLVVLDDETGVVVVGKRPSTPAAPAQAVFDCFEEAGIEPSAVASVTLGTTAGTNALLERRGARVLLLATAGFEDVPAIGRIDKEDPYDLHRAKPEPFIARADCIGVRERIGADGTVVTPLTDAELERVGGRLAPLLDAASRAPPASGSAEPRRPSPTRISCSAGSIRPRSWTAACSSTRGGRARRSRLWARGSGSTPSPPPVP